MLCYVICIVYSQYVVVVLSFPVQSDNNLKQDAAGDALLLATL